VNPSTVLGYGDWNQSSCAIFKNIFNEFPWYTTGTNGFVDVNDVVRAVVELMEKDIRGERFILSASTWSFRHLFELIADGFSKKRPNREATAFLSGLSWSLES
jgi:nucleoside-diphosphate-sugar epimerase